MSMDQNVILYGTSDTVAPLRVVELGPLSFVYTCDALRRICWQGTELVRAISWPIRDENWGTFPQTLVDEQVEETEGTFTARLKFSVADGQMTCTLTMMASSFGVLSLDLTMCPSGRPFSTNRAGFTVLHPIKDAAGAPLQVTHSDGDVEETEFPKLISPGQPVFDIQGLEYWLDGKTVDITFDGEVFEMEDQRNWSDASYKTYCVPLVFPFTYKIESRKTQSIRVLMSGESKDDAAASGAEAISLQRSDDKAPAIGLAVEKDWLRKTETISNSRVGHLLARIGPVIDQAFLAELAIAAQGLDLGLEIVIADSDTPLQALAFARDAIKAAGLAPARIIAMRESYLNSYQPSGPWPEGVNPAQVVNAARAVFADVEIGGGMLTNFTELNRCRPDPAKCDFLIHSNSAIVHTGDDMSVCETLEALPQIFESALAIADNKPYRLGLTSIGMRTNPYGAELAHNPGQVRYTMAHEDPRQRGLFGAAFAVGVLAATEGHPIEALCLAAPTGPFGIAYQRQSYPQIYFDGTPDAALYPIFHVVKAASLMAGQSRLHSKGLPDGVHAYGAQTPAGPQLMIANITPDPKTLDLNFDWQVAVLDSAAFTAATTNPNWMETAQQPARELKLEGYAVAFMEMKQRS